MTTYRLPCTLDVPAPALICERDEYSNGTYHAHTLECQISTVGEEGPSPLPWDDARRGVRLTWKERGRGPLTATVTCEAHAHSGDPAHLRALADHLEAVSAAWHALTALAGTPATGSSFLRRVAFLFGAEEIAVLRRVPGGDQACETCGPVEDVCAYAHQAEDRFRAQVLPDPFLEEEAA